MDIPNIGIINLLLLARRAVLPIATALLISFHVAAAQAGECPLPAHFIDSPHPSVDTVLDSESKTRLEKAIAKTGSLPSVSGTRPLTGLFGEVGSRRLTCLTDGSTLEEQVLENDRTGDVARFRYVVWNYTSIQARPVSYASDISRGPQRQEAVQRFVGPTPFS